MNNLDRYYVSAQIVVHCSGDDELNAECKTCGFETLEVVEKADFDTLECTNEECADFEVNVAGDNESHDIDDGEY